MLEFGTLRLNNYVLFDEAEIDLDYRGVTVINGYNKNATGDSGEKHSNATGKSLLMSSLPNLWFGSNPNVTVAKSRAKKDAFYRKDASVALDMKDGAGNTFAIQKYLAGRSIKYNISKNDKELKHNTPTAGEAWLEENFPLTEEQFYSTVYLDSRRPNLSLVGSGANRFKFFSDLFDLDKYDAVREHFKDAKGELAALSNKLEVIVENITEYEEQLESLSNTIGDYDEHWVEQESEELENIRKQKYSLSLAKAKIEKHEKSDAIDYDPKLEKKTVKTARHIADQIALVNACWDYEKSRDKKQELLDNTNARIKKIKKQLGKFKYDPNNPDKTRRKLRNWIDEVKKAAGKLDKIKRELAEVESEVDWDIKDSDIKDLDNIKEELAKHKAELSMLRAQKEQLNPDLIDEIENGQCPTCGADVDAKHLEKELKKVNKKIDHLIKVKIKTGERRVRELSEQKDVRKRHGRIATELALFKGDVEPKKIVKAEKICKALARLDSLLSSLSKIELPEEPEGYRSFSNEELDDYIAKRKEYKKLLEDLAIAKNSSNLMNELKDLGFKSATAVAKAEKKLKKVNIEERSGICLKVSSALEQRPRIQEKIENLKKTKTKLEKQLSESKLLDALIQAYGPSGLKRYACAEIAKKVERNINHLSHLIFAEGFKFHFDVTDTDFKIFYEDKRGVFDVRNLSGAEGRSFTVLSMLGILPLIPSELRTNIIVLDEMDANMGPTLRSMFCNELIPALNTIIPHVVVVTPQDDVYPDARRFTVVKEGTKSTLVSD